ncbi:TetR/AcrR family transcriptional regulator [Halalkalibacter krulwichiae]|uniref:HTH-type transcriptional repressor KstR2 n=1 Tax=Halalkalibacter krulwichiae TaxID=199441 RepID=A0A1X9M644_9BACI|nr:TetR/AcrR family transcriptional regulator [Halalkalibacter krulwichiae]ARK28916.1 HTH-type transcriptional repressor KstR2 [Halalkalibacter krulwichiae]
MNGRKQHVIQMAHQLFIDKGFQATSIQDILDYANISKGTFYNYFASKNELLMAIFKSIYDQLKKERNDLLIGQDRTDVEIFVSQLELQMKMNRKNKLITLYEEAFVSNDVELKQFIKDSQLQQVHWLYGRFIDLFGQQKAPYLLDCAIMFLGILHHNVRYYLMAHGHNAAMYPVVRYSVDRIMKIVEEVETANDQLIQPEVLESWFPERHNHFQDELYRIVLHFKKQIDPSSNNHLQLLDFLIEELLHTKKPRQFVVQSVLSSIQSDSALHDKEAFNQLEQLITAFFNQDNNTR